MIEILAPAGDEKSAVAAINAGANAVYLGLTSFSARSSAANFDLPALEKIIMRAHLFGVKVYVAMNTLVKEDELAAFIQTAIAVHNAGADAIIIQDLYLGAYLKKTYPQLTLHLSTQAGVCNSYGARLAKKLGYSRVVLARETAAEDIKRIAQIIETEIFVQGALCTCFSGQCYLSSFAGGNSGNRGKCKQPCRKKYTLSRTGAEGKNYAISLSDLSLGEEAARFAEAGVTSFKIEGRMRRPEYVAAAVKYYKKIFAGGTADTELSALKRTFNRGNYTKGLAFGQDKRLISSSVQGHVGEFIGTVSVVGGRYFVSGAERRAAGDGFKILRGGSEVCGAVFSAPAKGGFYLESSSRLKNGDKVFITTDEALNSSLLSETRALKVEITARAAEGERLEVQFNGKRFVSSFTVEKARSVPLTADDIKKCFSKCGGLPLELCFTEIDVADNCFVPLSALNSFRREAYASFVRETALKTQLIDKILPLPERENTGANCKTAVIATDLTNLDADVGILWLDDFSQVDERLYSSFKGKKYLYLPSFATDAEAEGFKNLLTAFDGAYCGGNYAVELCAELNKELFYGTGFNLSNSVSLAQTANCFACISKELSIKEARAVAAENTFYLTAGNIKVMDLIYCPFGKTCSACDMRATYPLTDEDGRQFTLRRYRLSSCRFELYNCADLACLNNFTGKLFCLVSVKNANAVLACADDLTALKKQFSNYTKGHSESTVL